MLARVRDFHITFLLAVVAIIASGLAKDLGLFKFSGTLAGGGILLLIATVWLREVGE